MFTVDCKGFYTVHQTSKTTYDQDYYLKIKNMMLGNYQTTYHVIGGDNW